MTKKKTTTAAKKAPAKKTKTAAKSPTKKTAANKTAAVKKTSSAKNPVGTFDPSVSIDRIIVVSNIRKYEVTQENDPALADLASSIKAYGILEPLLLHAVDGENSYAVIAGHRRLCAAKSVKKKDVPAVIYTGLSDKQILEMQLSENLNRKNLRPTEEATVYERMHSELGYTHEEISARIGKSERHIRRYIRLLSLPEKFQSKIDIGDISLIKAEMLCSLQPHILDSIANGAYSYLLNSSCSGGEFSEAIKRYFMKDLSGYIKFDLKKEYQDEEGNTYPPCAKCASKKQGELFEEFANYDACPNPDCYRAKEEIVEEQEYKNSVSDDDDDDDNDFQETPEEMEARQKREEKWEKENQKIAIKVEYYIQRKTEKGFSATDYFYNDDDSLGGSYCNQNDILNELYVKHVGKTEEQLKQSGTYEEIIKAKAIYNIYLDTDYSDEDDIAKWIGCDKYPEEPTESEEPSHADEEVTNSDEVTEEDTE